MWTKKWLEPSGNFLNEFGIILSTQTGMDARLKNGEGQLFRIIHNEQKTAHATSHYTSHHMLY